jgi:3-hydroxymyristoyl/3-hydroxydecanoyl-(acyl carrier protein) dehydratase
VSESHHFRAFSFVDRVAAVQPGVSIRGSYTIPGALTEFSNSLVGEAVGQLAAWCAMAAVDFKSRPVAGIAGLIEMLAPVSPGQPLELAADIESVDIDAIAYRGIASANGAPVLRLHNCVGPMLPVEEFDAPQALRNRFALLCERNAMPGAFGGVPALPLDNLNGEPGRLARATLRVPADAPFFADHFPRKPVFPGSLLMQSNLHLVAKLAAEIPPPTQQVWRLQSVSDMKLRTFIPPGESLDLEAKLQEQGETASSISVEIRRGKRLVGSATVTLAAR